MPTIKDPNKRERNAQLIFGCSESEAIRLNDGLALRHKKSLAMRYSSQYYAAARRGIGWEITFPQWLATWQASGKLAERGVGAAGYCMARHGDVGPYSVDNVSIQPSRTNSRDGMVKARPNFPAAVVKRPGYGRGWTFRKGHASPYQVVVARKYIGCFKTQQAAEIAYRCAVGHLLSSSVNK